MNKKIGQIVGAVSIISTLISPSVVWGQQNFFPGDTISLPTSCEEQGTSNVEEAKKKCQEAALAELGKQCKERADNINCLEGQKPKCDGQLVCIKSPSLDKTGSNVVSSSGNCTEINTAKADIDKKNKKFDDLLAKNKQELEGLENKLKTAVDNNKPQVDINNLKKQVASKKAAIAKQEKALADAKSKDLKKKGLVCEAKGDCLIKAEWECIPDSNGNQKSVQPLRNKQLKLAYSGKLEPGQ